MTLPSEGKKTPKIHPDEEKEKESKKEEEKEKETKKEEENKEEENKENKEEKTEPKKTEGGEKPEFEKVVKKFTNGKCYQIVRYENNEKGQYLAGTMEPESQIWVSHKGLDYKHTVWKALPEPFGTPNQWVLESLLYPKKFLTAGDD